MGPSRLILPSAVAPRACYVHLPFCRRRCYYCDFPIQVVGDKPGVADAAAEQYVALLLREMRASPRVTDKRAPLRSVYFGGGTPSLTPPALLADILAELHSTQGVEPDAEITLEMDPGTFDADRLARYIDSGVSRVSLGVQSFDAELLKKAGRAHSLEDVEKALGLLESAPRKLHVSIDLISGLPFQTMESWRASLAIAAQAPGVGHVSVYDLQVEQGTAFGRWYTPGAFPLPDEKRAADMFREASSILGSAGFDHYEVSSYARPGNRCIHNRAYWANEPFWGFGMGATSHIGGARLPRPRIMREYSKWVERLESNGWEAAAIGGATLEPPGSVDELQTRVMLGLRTNRGVSLSELKRPEQPEGLATAAFDACVKVAEQNPQWATVMRSESQNFDCLDRRAALGDGDEALAEPRVVLNDPEGLLFSNEVISSIFAEMERRI